jgi:hypothetical protein
MFAGIALVYTLLVFLIGMPRAYARLSIATERILRPFPQILKIHLIFLLALFGLDWTFNYLYPILPEWTHYTFVSQGASKSILDVAFLLLMLIMGAIERGRLLIERE